MYIYEIKFVLVKQFYVVLICCDWQVICKFFIDDVIWVLFGDNQIFGLVVGVEVVVVRVELIVSFGLNFEFKYILVSWDNVVFLLYNIVCWNDFVLDEYLVMVCILCDGKIVVIEIYLFDLLGMNVFFVRD